MANKGIFVSTKIKGTPLSFVSTSEQENGMVFEKGDIVTNKPLIYNAVAATGSEPIYIAGDPAWSYNASSVINQNEDEYVIPAGKNFRVYPLTNGDRFTVADYSIDGSSAVAVGDTVGITGGKLAIGGSTSAFEGKVVKVETQSFAYWVGQEVDTCVKLVTVEVVINAA